MTKQPKWGPERPWHGGEIPPVHKDTVVEVRFRDETRAVGNARKFFWNHSGLSTGADSISYRVCLDTAKPIGELVVGETYRERSGENLWTVTGKNYAAGLDFDGSWKAVDQDGNDGCGWDKTGEFVDEDAPGCDLIEHITDANREAPLVSAPPVPTKPQEVLETGDGDPVLIERIELSTNMLISQIRWSTFFIVWLLLMNLMRGL